MSSYQLIDLQDGYFAIGLPLQDNFTMLLDVRHFETHQPRTEAISSITSISDGMFYMSLGPFASMVEEYAEKTWHAMKVVESAAFQNELNKWFLDTKSCWCLLQTQTGQYAVGVPTPTGKPIPIYYLERPDDLYDFACYVMDEDEE